MDSFTFVSPHEYKKEITMDAEPFTTLINQVITILTSYYNTVIAGEAINTQVDEDAYEQDINMYDAVKTRFECLLEPEGGRARGVLKNFIEDPLEYKLNLQNKLEYLLQSDSEFADKLRQIVSRPLFIERDQELQEYARFLSKDSPWVWLFTALEGYGKTHLLEQMQKKTPTDTPMVRLDFAGERYRYDLTTGERNPIDALSYLGAFATQLRTECDPQKYEEFEKELAQAYEDSTNNIFLINQILQAGENSTLSGNLVNMIISIDKFMKEQRQKARMRATFAFHKLMDSFQPNQLVIQLDTCEWLMEAVNVEVRQWLVQDILLPLHQSMYKRQKQYHVVMMSSVAVALPLLDSKYQKRSSLEPLEKQSVQQYLQRIGVDDPKLREQFYDMTDGHAFCVSILCELWHQWEKEGKSPPSDETLIPFQKEFYEKADKDFIEKHVLDKFDKSPLHELTKFGIILREFNLPILTAVFSKLLESGAEKVFKQLIERSYIIHRKERYTYAMLELFRTVLGQSILKQEPKIWQGYHKRAQDYFKDHFDPIELSDSSDWYYHNLAYYLG